MNDKVLIQCRTAVNKDAVRREVIDGVEHIIVSSSTLPDNVVMNGGLYPSEEIEKSYLSLENTFAPVEHPTANGEFISAATPEAVHNFDAGAFNRNVRRENGRVHVDKYINVNVALKTDRGKRLLDRISELETNVNARPIHTSVGVWTYPEQLDEFRTNEDGKEYYWIARDMEFDHDAILLDSVGAAKPEQGVGMAVNSDGEKCKVETFELNEMSMSEQHNSVVKALEKASIANPWIEELFDDRVIYNSGERLYTVPYVTDENGTTTIVGIPLQVERKVTYPPVTNSKGKEMTEKSEEVQEEVLEINSESDEKGATESDLAEIVANAIKPLTDKIQDLEGKLNSQEEAKLEELANIVGNSDKFAGLDAEEAKKLGVNTLESMIASTKSAFGVMPTVNNSQAPDQYAAPTEAPE